MVYNFAFYLFGATFNSFFLLYVALFSLSIYALILGLSNADAKSMINKFSDKTPEKWISFFLLFISLPLAIVEAGQCINYIKTGQVPTAPSLIFALDLSIVVPNTVLPAVLLWKHKPWVYVLAAIMLVKAFTYGLVLIVGTTLIADSYLNQQELLEMPGSKSVGSPSSPDTLECNAIEIPFAKKNIMTVVTKKIKIVIGFLILFAMYHGAEYFVLFRYEPMMFLLIQGTFFIAAILIARWQRFKGLEAWGVDFNSTGVRQLTAGIVMGAFLYGTTFVINILVGSEEVVKIPSVTSMINPLALFWFGNLFSSFSEDILTRGYVYKHLNKSLSIPSLVFVSSLIYLLNHIYRLNDGMETWSYLFALGLLFIIPVILTKKLWFTAGMHWIGNTTFYFTHTLIKTKPGPSTLSPNTLFLICILLFIPITIAVIRLCKFYPIDDAN